jgi:hypothetical protein
LLTDFNRGKRFQMLVESVVRQNRQSIIALQDRKWSSLTEGEFEALKKEKEAIKRDRDAIRRVKRTLRNIHFDTDSSASEREVKHETARIREAELHRERAMMEKEVEKRKRTAIEPELHVRRGREMPLTVLSTAYNDTATWLYGLAFCPGAAEASQEGHGLPVEARRFHAEVDRRRQQEEQASKTMKEAGEPAGREQKVQSERIALPTVPELREIDVCDTVDKLLKTWTTLNEDELAQCSATKGDDGFTAFPDMVGMDEDSSSVDTEDSMDVSEISDHEQDTAKNEERWNEEELARLREELNFLKSSNERLRKENQKDRKRSLERAESLARDKAEREKIIAEAAYRRELEAKERAMMEKRLVEEYKVREARKQAVEQEQRKRIIMEWEEEKKKREMEKKLEREKLLEEIRQEMIDARRKDEQEARQKSRGRRWSRSPPLSSSPSRSPPNIDVRRGTSRRDDSQSRTVRVNLKSRKVDDLIRHVILNFYLEPQQWRPRTYQPANGGDTVICMSDVEYARHELNRFYNSDLPCEDAVTEVAGRRSIFFGTDSDQSPTQALLTSTLSSNGIKVMFEKEANIPKIDAHALISGTPCCSRSEITTGSLLWQFATAPGRSELFDSLFEMGWKPIYVRGTGMYYSAHFDHYAHNNCRSGSNLVLWEPPRTRAIPTTELCAGNDA